jgi:hypothetical protein
MKERKQTYTKYKTRQHNSSILIYLCANLTAQRPITKSAQVQKKKKYTYKENT